VTTPETKILIAKIGAPHGVRGEVRVQSYTDDPLAIKTYRQLYDHRGRKFTVQTARPAKNMLVVRFKEITSREDAEALTNTELFIDRTALPDIEDEDEFYLSDLIGVQVVDTAGVTVGLIKSAQNFGAGDMLEIQSANQDGSFADGTHYLPFTKSVFPHIDLASGKVTVIPPEETIVEGEIR